MDELIRREFIVEAPISAAWQHLAKVEQWPSWATHIQQIDLTPAGELTAHSTGIIHLKNGIKSTFRMTEINAFQNWTWVGNFLWLTVTYDHQFEKVDPQRTKLTWVVAGKGFGLPILGRLFATIYNRNLDRAIPCLMDEMKSIEE